MSDPADHIPRRHLAFRDGIMKATEDTVPPTRTSVGAPLTAATVMLTVIIADPGSKTLAVGALIDGPVDAPGPFWFRLVANRGAVMGFPLPGWVLIAVVVAVLTMAARSLTRPGSRLATVGWGLVAGGAVGNLADRFLHRPRFPDHAVVDWIASSLPPTFNIADAAVVAGLVAVASAPDRPFRNPEVAS